MRNNAGLILIILLAFLIFCCPLTIMGMALREANTEDQTKEEEKEDDDRYVPEYRPSDRENPLQTAP